MLLGVRSCGAECQDQRVCCLFCSGPDLRQVVALACSGHAALTSPRAQQGANWQVHLRCMAPLDTEHSHVHCGTGEAATKRTTSGSHKFVDLEGRRVMVDVAFSSVDCHCRIIGDKVSPLRSYSNAERQAAWSLSVTLDLWLTRKTSNQNMNK